MTKNDISFLLTSVFVYAERNILPEVKKQYPSLTEQEAYLLSLKRASLLRKQVRKELEDIIQSSYNFDNSILPRSKRQNIVVEKSNG